MLLLGLPSKKRFLSPWIWPVSRYKYYATNLLPCFPSHRLIYKNRIVINYNVMHMDLLNKLLLVDGAELQGTPFGVTGVR